MVAMGPVGAWLARELGRPYTLTVHDYLGSRERFVIDSRWCRRIVAVSESVRSELLDRTGLPDEMVAVDVLLYLVSFYIRRTWLFRLH